MTYRARHARAATPVSPQVRVRKLRAGRPQAGEEARPGQGARTAIGDQPDVQTAVSTTAGSRLGRLGTPLLLVGAVAFALALARFIAHAAEPSFLARMFDLGIYRDGGLIVRHAYHFRSGLPTPLYDWVSPGGNPFTYPPFAAGMFAVVSFLAPAVLRWGMTALSFGALIVAVWLTVDSSGVPKSRVRT